jgi:hypothetical protein
MSTDKPAKKARSTKTKADLEAKIAELESKLNALAAQASKPAETRPTSPPPAPKPQVQQRPPPPPPAPKPEITHTSSSKKEEVAPAYSATSSSGYTGNRYYATRQRLAYHPPDKQFTGQVTVQVSRPEPAPAPEPEPAQAESEPQKQKEKPRRIEPPAPTVRYTGENYYRTRQRLAYHPPDKQFIQTVAVKFEDAPTAAQVESTASSQSSSSSEQKRSRDAELAAYEKEYLERVQQRKAEAKTAPAPSKAKPHGTMPAGWKPS